MTESFIQFSVYLNNPVKALTLQKIETVSLLFSLYLMNTEDRLRSEKEKVIARIIKELFATSFK